MMNETEIAGHDEIAGADTEDGASRGLSRMLREMARENDAPQICKALGERIGTDNDHETLAFLVEQAERGLECREEHGFSSIEQILVEVGRHTEPDPENGCHVRRIAEWVMEHGDEAGIQAPPTAWRKLVGTYMDMAEYSYALKLAEHALETYPADLLLLGDAIRAAKASGNWQAGVAHITAAEKTGWNFENGWYAAVRAGEFYMNYALTLEPGAASQADAQSDARPQTRSAVLERGVDIIDACLKHFPLEESLYNTKARLYIADNQIAKARAVLEKAILGKHKGKDGSSSTTIAAPQCCNTYLEHILDNTTDYEKIEEIAALGIQNCAGGAHSDEMRSNFLYRQALAMDALIHEEERMGDRAGGFANEAMVKKALEAYEIANTQSLYFPQRQNVIRSRMSILRARSGIDYVNYDIDERLI